jgi:hypothetical protein
MASPTALSTGAYPGFRGALRFDERIDRRLVRAQLRPRRQQRSVTLAWAERTIADGKATLSRKVPLS